MQEKIEHLSAKLYVNSTPHRFKKEKNSFDRGYMKVNLWMDALCSDAIAKDRQIVKDFDAMVEKLTHWIETLEESEYKAGMKKALHDAGYTQVRERPF